MIGLRITWIRAPVMTMGWRLRIVVRKGVVTTLSRVNSSSSRVSLSVVLDVGGGVGGNGEEGGGG